jgi:hypothetical protein
MLAINARGKTGFLAEELKLFLQKITREMEMIISVLSVSSS